MDEPDVDESPPLWIGQVLVFGLSDGEPDRTGEGIAYAALTG